MLDATIAIPVGGTVAGCTGPGSGGGNASATPDRSVGATVSAMPTVAVAPGAAFAAARTVVMPAACTGALDARPIPGIAGGKRCVDTVEGAARAAPGPADLNSSAAATMVDVGTPRLALGAPPSACGARVARGVGTDPGG